MCWYCCIVLLKDEHVSSNAAADHWQQFLHQQDISVILPVDFSPIFNKNQVGTAEFP